jgi:hypothetical protein
MKNKRLMFYAFVAITILATPSAFADTVVGSVAGGWRAWTTSDVDQNGTPYWDGNSYDSGSSYNIGNYLTNTGGFIGGNGPGVSYDYWGTATGGSDKFSMDWVSGSNNVAMKLEVAGYAPQNEFGYLDSKGAHTLFPGSAVQGASMLFTPTEDYVFYLKSPDGFFTTDRRGGDAYQHFAIFRETPGIYWIGMEDLKCNSDYDYNDMIVRVSQSPVPLPATIYLLGLGLVGLAGVRRKLQH